MKIKLFKNNYKKANTFQWRIQKFVKGFPKLAFIIQTVSHFGSQILGWLTLLCKFGAKSGGGGSTATYPSSVVSKDEQ
jgi:hypothetical protein